MTKPTENRERFKRITKLKAENNKDALAEMIADLEIREKELEGKVEILDKENDGLDLELVSALAKITDLQTQLDSCDSAISKTVNDDIEDIIKGVKNKLSLAVKAGRGGGVLRVRKAVEQALLDLEGIK